MIQNRLGSVPGRSLQDLVNSQPGWLYEGNAVLHPRGSEYQTQFVVDGIPLTDNRSPSFGPAIDADDVQSLSIYTAGIPAEYGRKMGGVVEVNTLQDSQPGFHGQMVLAGGSFDSAGRAQGSTPGAKILLAPAPAEHDGPLSESGGSAELYEYGHAGRFFGQLRARPDAERPSAIHRSPRALALRHSQRTGAAGRRPAPDRRQHRDHGDRLLPAHLFVQRGQLIFARMVRDNAIGFNSNPESTPIEVFQQNLFREAYFKGTATIDHGRHEWKFGFESDNTFLNENFRYHITDPSQFDDDTPMTFASWETGRTSSNPYSCRTRFV